MANIILEQYTPGERDTWQWKLAEFTDIKEIVDLAQSMYQVEIENIFTPDPALLMRNVSIGIVNQSYNPLDEQVIVARDQLGRLIAWAWIERGGYVTYAPEEIAEAKFAHVALDLPARTRIVLLAQMLQQWEMWAAICKIPVLVSTTIRDEQSAFMKLHRQAGYTVRGSYAYKRVEL